MYLIVVSDIDILDSDTFHQVSSLIYITLMEKSRKSGNTIFVKGRTAELCKLLSSFMRNKQLRIQIHIKYLDIIGNVGAASRTFSLSSNA